MIRQRIYPGVDTYMEFETTSCGPGLGSGHGITHLPDSAFLCHTYFDEVRGVARGYSAGQYNPNNRGINPPCDGWEYWDEEDPYVSGAKDLGECEEFFEVG